MKILVYKDTLKRVQVGAAGCIEIEPGRYLFFGWASE